MTRSVLLRQCGSLLSVLGAVVGCAPAPAPPPEIRSYREVGDFTLTDQTGNPLSSKALQGKVWVANFVFTSCTAECLILSKRMANLQKQFSGNDRVAFVSFSVDPGTDNPARLAKYADLFDAGTHWSFLTGDHAAVETLIKEKFLLPLAQSSEESDALQKATLIHSDRFAIVDSKGVVRAYVNGMQPKAEQEIAAIVEQLVAE
ncbi:MAG: protein SCO1/2 [Verrucomicrobia bacterium]|nr:MAG: protein SCO1/2 [Verrucomicrobiota bacterium]